jgi:hypothetical protein
VTKVTKKRKTPARSRVCSKKCGSWVNDDEKNKQAEVHD